MADGAAIKTSAFSKTYRGGVRALTGLDVRVERGEVYGFLGPNGAGKSTTIRLLLDLIRPTSGRATLLGLDSRGDSVEARRRVGYLLRCLPGDLRLYDRLTGREQLDSLARLRGMRDRAYRDELAARFTLPLERPIRELSKGNRQKLGIVQLPLSKGVEWWRFLVVAVAAVAVLLVASWLIERRDLESP